MQSTDVVVIGGGMAGVSVASELAADRRVVVLDMEPTLAFHTTGRSAAMFLESYGGPVIRALTTGSRERLEAGTDDGPILTPLPMMHLGLAGRGAAVEQLHRDVRPLVPDVALLDPAAAARLQPWLRPERVELALLEPGARAIDVHALHSDYVRRLRAHGGRIEVAARVREVRRHGGEWEIDGGDGRSWRAPVVVDAAGAWADAVAEMFGAGRLGLRPLRRTAFMIDAPPEPTGPAAPMIADLDDAFYIKPDAGQLLCSPADETEQVPGNARPDEVEIARALDEIRAVTTLDARHVRSAWAGLRSFVADRSPVVGFDPSVEGLFWFAAQGGYGIQTAPALARTGAALLRGEAVPADLAARGLHSADLAADRPGLYPGNRSDA